MKFICDPGMTSPLAVNNTTEMGANPTQHRSKRTKTAHLTQTEQIEHFESFGYIHTTPPMMAKEDGVHMGGGDVPTLEAITEAAHKKDDSPAAKSHQDASPIIPARKSTRVVKQTHKFVAMDGPRMQKETGQTPIKGRSAARGTVLRARRKVEESQKTQNSSMESPSSIMNFDTTVLTSQSDTSTLDTTLPDAAEETKLTNGSHVLTDGGSSSSAGTRPTNAIAAGRISPVVIHEEEAAAIANLKCASVILTAMGQGNANAYVTPYGERSFNPLLQPTAQAFTSYATPYAKINSEPYVTPYGNRPEVEQEKSSESVNGGSDGKAENAIPAIPAMPIEGDQPVERKSPGSDVEHEPNGILLSTETDTNGTADPQEKVVSQEKELSQYLTEDQIDGFLALANGGTSTDEEDHESDISDDRTISRAMTEEPKHLGDLQMEKVVNKIISTLEHTKSPLHPSFYLPQNAQLWATDLRHCITQADLPVNVIMSREQSYSTSMLYAHLQVHDYRINHHKTVSGRSGINPALASTYSTHHTPHYQQSPYGDLLRPQTSRVKNVKERNLVKAYGFAPLPGSRPGEKRRRTK